MTISICGNNGTKDKCSFASNGSGWWEFRSLHAVDHIIADSQLQNPYSSFTIHYRWCLLVILQNWHHLIVNTFINMLLPSCLGDDHYHGFSKLFLACAISVAFSVWTTPHFLWLSWTTFIHRCKDCPIVEEIISWSVGSQCCIFCKDLSRFLVI